MNNTKVQQGVEGSRQSHDKVMKNNSITFYGNVTNCQIQQEAIGSSQESRNGFETGQIDSMDKVGNKCLKTVCKDDVSKNQESGESSDMNIINPRVFISYSWSSEKYKSMVLRLAENLRHDGVNVIVESWDLKSGYDKYYFMEHSVEIADKVLILCDLGYVEKANNRTGGVGDETSIITPDVYGNNKQEKFIPVLMEGKDVVPRYLKGRIGVDFTPGDRNKKYRDLLRVIFDRPIEKKPELGQPPKWLDEPVRDTSKKNDLDEGF